VDHDEVETGFRCLVVVVGFWESAGRGKLDVVTVTGRDKLGTYSIGLRGGSFPYKIAQARLRSANSLIPHTWVIVSLSHVGIWPMTVDHGSMWCVRRPPVCGEKRGYDGEMGSK